MRWSNQQITSRHRDFWLRRRLLPLQHSRPPLHGHPDGEWILACYLRSLQRRHATVRCNELWRSGRCAGRDAQSPRRAPDTCRGQPSLQRRADPPPTWTASCRVGRPRGSSPRLCPRPSWRSPIPSEECSGPRSSGSMHRIALAWNCSRALMRQPPSSACSTRYRPAGRHPLLHSPRSQKRRDRSMRPSPATPCERTAI